MALYRIDQRAESYGHAVGIVRLDRNLPRPPGDVGNASTFDYPVLYRTVDGLDEARCRAGAPELTGAVVAAARYLADQGVRAIASDCAAMLQYQDAVRDAVSVPVALSPLQLLPFIERTLKRGRPIGIVAADARTVTGESLAAAGLVDSSPIVVRDMHGEPEYRAAVIENTGRLDSERMCADAVRVAGMLIEEQPGIGAILLECTLLGPYAHAIGQATGRPVFDAVSLIDYLRAGTQRAPAKGFL